MPTKDTHGRPTRFEPDAPCRNCGDATSGRYCPSCGQAKRPPVSSVLAMLADVLEDQFLVNRALPRTLRALLLRPGLLTREYLDGKRASYVAPFRLYLASSVLFFLAFSVFGLRSIEERAATVDAQVEAALAEMDSARAVGPSVVGVRSAPDGPAVAPPDVLPGGEAGAAPRTVQPWARNLQINLGSEETSERVRRRTLDRWGHLPFQEALRAFMGEYLRYAPQTVFVLLPLFALILHVLHAGSGRYYAEHFVFSLHLHTFAFVAALAAIPLGWSRGAAVVGPLLVLYTWLALRRAYGQGLLTTLWKGLALGMTYALVLLIAFTGTIVLTFLRL